MDHILKIEERFVMLRKMQTANYRSVTKKKKKLHT